MVLKIYGFPFSTATRLVVFVCKEKQIPYELITVDLFKGEHKQPAYTKFHPFGQVPYIDDDGFILFESRPIVRYLLKKHASQGTQGLLPTNPQAEARAEQALSIEASSFDPNVSGIVTELYFKPQRGLGTDEANLARLKDTLNEKLDAYEVILSKQKFLGGDSITIGDLAHAPYGTLLETVGQGEFFTSRPNVARWWKEVTSRPAWEAVKAECVL